MSGYRKLSRTSSQRKAMLRSLTTQILFHGKIKTTEQRAKEARRQVEKLISLAVRECDNFEEVKVKAKVARKDKDGKRIKEEVNGKKKTVYDEVEKTIKKDNPSRLSARRQMLAILYPASDFEKEGLKKSKRKVDLVNKLFEEYAPKYKERKGGYTRIIKLGQRKGDQAMEVLFELV